MRKLLEAAELQAIVEAAAAADADWQAKYAAHDRLIDQEIADNQHDWTEPDAHPDQYRQWSEERWRDFEAKFTEEAGLPPVSRADSMKRRYEVSEIGPQSLGPYCAADSSHFYLWRGGLKDTWLSYYPPTTIVGKMMYAPELIRYAFPDQPEEFIHRVGMGQVPKEELRPLISDDAAEFALNNNDEMPHVEFTDPVTGELLTASY